MSPVKTLRVEDYPKLKGYFKPNICGVPPEITEEKEWRKLWYYGNRELEAKTRLVRTGVLKCITLVQQVKFDLENRDIYVKLANNITGRLLNVPEDERMGEILRRPVLASITIQGKKPVVYISKVYGEETDVNELLDIVEELELTPLHLLVWGYGYHFSRDTGRVMIPRLLSLFKIDNRPVYVVQLTPPNTGKTHFALRNRTAFNWGYTAEVPSLAYLVYNARDGFYGIVFTRDGVAFDGMEKWSDQSFRLSKDYELLLTGMEQGIWGRGVSTPVNEVYKVLNMLFLGNVTFEEDKPDRKYVQEVLSFMWNTEVFLDRISLCDVMYERIDLQRYISDYILPDGVLYSLVKTLEEKAQKVTGVKSSLQGRLRRHSIAVQKVMSVLGLEPDSEKVDEMVEYGVRYSWENQ